MNNESQSIGTRARRVRARIALGAAGLGIAVAGAGIAGGVAFAQSPARAGLAAAHHHGVIRPASAAPLATASQHLAAGLSRGVEEPATAETRDRAGSVDPRSPGAPSVDSAPLGPVAPGVARSGGVDRPASSTDG
ncbi:MAG TPA: hypothetical protein VMV02_01435 [Acidimicrobiales bacterium]|nr:hypothetical protein [Acidimicrobiales bacterium]